MVIWINVLWTTHTCGCFHLVKITGNSKGVCVFWSTPLTECQWSYYRLLPSSVSYEQYTIHYNCLPMHQLTLLTTAHFVNVLIQLAILLFVCKWCACTATLGEHPPPEAHTSCTHWIPFKKNLAKGSDKNHLYTLFPIVIQLLYYACYTMLYMYIEMNFHCRHQWVWNQWWRLWTNVQ